MRRVPRRRAVVWSPDRRTASQFAVMTVLVATASLAAGLMVRGFSPADVTGVGDASVQMSGPLAADAEVHRQTVGLMNVRTLNSGAADVVRQRWDEALRQPQTPAPRAVGSAQSQAPSQDAQAQASDVATPQTAAETGTTPQTSQYGEAAESMPMFDGRPLRPVKQMNMRVTAYSPDERSCGIWADGYTASGYSVWTNGMKLVAADTRLLPFGSLVSIPGYNGGRPVPVLDRGGAIKGHRLDVLYPTHEIALQWGVQDLTITVWEYADE